MPSKVFSGLLVVSLITLAILCSVQFTALNLEFYRFSWIMFDVPSSTGMDIEGLGQTGAALIQFFKGSIETPATEMEIWGATRPVYNSMELQHLDDVRELFRYGFQIRNLAIVVALLSGLYLKKRLSALAKPLIRSGALGAMFLALAAIPAWLNFGNWWTRLHLLAFTNDLWLLDPNTDWLIRMFPQSFFVLAVKRIGITYLILMVLYVLLGFFVRHLAAHDSH